MPRKVPYPLQKVTLNIHHGDFSRLRELHPDLPVSEVVREIVHGYIMKVEETVEKKQENQNELAT
jgi:hypothetical protein